MPIERVFLGWDGHALPRAATWLIERFGDALDAPIVVTPTARAGRQLLQLLVEQRGGALDAVPQLVTPLHLPELLYDAPPLADAWTSGLLRTEALRRIDDTTRATIVPTPPDADDLVGWWSLSQRLVSVVEDAAAAGLSLDTLVGRIASMKLDDHAIDRLDALRRIETAYRERLATYGLHDAQHARLDAIARRACRCEQPIVLVAAADLSAQLARMLEQVAAPIHALVHAPTDAAAGFDELGRFNAGYWQHRAPPIHDEQTHFVDRPIDQARQVVATLAHLSPATDDVTIGLHDATLAASVRRAVEHAGAAVRDAAGRPLVRSRPATLLCALARFAAARRFDDFAALLRHPDVSAYAGPAAGVRDWLTFLDEYASHHLQSRLIEPWLGQRSDAMHALWSRIGALLPDDETRPVAQWAQPIADVLTAIYPGELSRHAPHEHDLFIALQTIGEALTTMAAVPANEPATTFAQAVTLLLQQLATAGVPDRALPGETAAIEMMGFLELPLDDAPHLVLAGMNEQTGGGADAWLPDSMRRMLDITDSTSRFARDVYLLTAMLHSRDVTLIAGRVSAEGDPLSPSRLLLMGDDAQLARRVGAFYDHDEQPVPPPRVLESGGRTRFLIPRPAPLERAIDTLRVTAFRDYLACPFRFYLRHVLNLRESADGAVEMEASAFGTLAHDVLDDFAQDDVRDADDADAIAAFLSRQLDVLARRRFGESARMAVRLQVEMLRQRLVAFAGVQAQLRREGWRIVYWEGKERDDDGRPKRRSAALLVDGLPFTITGRIDRIDHHPGEDRYRVLDYKTADGGLKPDATHRHRGAWVDLQLPLYRDLAVDVLTSDAVELGYINLPKKPGDVRLEIAPWDEQTLIEARDMCFDVIRAVRAGVFWPPKEPPRYEDELAAICADLAFDREALVKLSGGASP